MPFAQLRVTKPRQPCDCRPAQYATPPLRFHEPWTTTPGAHHPKRLTGRPAVDCAHVCPFPHAGRVFAVEMALYTIAETVSGFWGGFMFDGLRLSTQGSSGVMAVVATAVTVRDGLPIFLDYLHAQRHVLSLNHCVPLGDVRLACPSLSRWCCGAAASTSRRHRRHGARAFDQAQASFQCGHAHSPVFSPGTSARACVTVVTCRVAKTVPSVSRRRSDPHDQLRRQYNAWGLHAAQ